MGEDFTRKFEGVTRTSYSEFGEDGKELKNWGMAEYRGKIIEFYSNPEFIREYFSGPILKHLESQGVDLSKKLNLVDFGGGDGILIMTLLEQLKKGGYENIHGLNIDYTLKSLLKMRGEVRVGNIKGIDVAQGSIKNLPIQNSSVDIGVSRHVIQYFGKEAQPEMLQSIYDSLKPGAIFIMKWPGADNPEQAPILTDFYAKTFAVCTGELPEEVAKNKYFVSYQEVEDMAKKIGFKIVSSGKCSARLGITAEGFSDRFDLSDEQRREMAEILKDFYLQYKDHPDQFEMVQDEKGVTYNIQHHNYIILEK